MKKILKKSVLCIFSLSSVIGYSEESPTINTLIQNINEYRVSLERAPTHELFAEYAESWDKLISLYEGSEGNEEVRLNALEYWDASLNESELRALQLSALASNVNRDFFTNGFFEVFSETTDMLEIRPMVYAMAKSGDDAVASSFANKTKKTSDKAIREAVSQAMSWYSYWKLVDAESKGENRFPYNNIDSSHISPNYPAPEHDRSVIIDVLEARSSNKVTVQSTVDPTNALATPTVPEVVKVVEEVAPNEPAIEEPAEVAPVEVAEETTEQSSQWWLWLVGAVVVVGGLGLVLRRKN